MVLRKKQLLLGCGKNKKKRVTYKDSNFEWDNVITLDYDERCNPDVLWDLRYLPLPFQDGEFDEIHAYEVLEHVGKQGDFKLFFAQFTEFHRILKPGGRMFITVPRSDGIWAWGDPGHTRVLNEGTFAFLDQDMYNENDTMTDYRDIYSCSFKCLLATKDKDTLVIILEKR